MSSEEKDMSMDDNTWESNITKVNTFFKEYKAELASVEEAQESVAVIKSQMKRGAKHPLRRKKFWGAILFEGRDLELIADVVWPIQKGKQSTLPQFVQDSLHTIAAESHEAYEQFWNDNPIVQATSIISDRNKTAGGSIYETASDYADARVLAIKQRFTKHFSNERWNGEYSEEGMSITPPPAPEEDSDESN
jgi:hypothetical protein